MTPPPQSRKIWNEQKGNVNETAASTAGSGLAPPRPTCSVLSCFGQKLESPVSQTSEKADES